MTATLKSRLQKLEQRLHPPPPRLDLVRLIQDIRAEEQRMLNLPLEEQEKALQEAESLPKGAPAHTAASSIRQGREVQKYLESLDENRPECKLLRPHPIEPGHLGVLALIHNRASGKPQP
ncbi:MAG: hypothetical protein V1850_02005 [Candidatus Bathyarchaeota archaeon]